MSTETNEVSKSQTTALSEQGKVEEGLGVTALYTAQTWAWADFQYAELFSTDQSRGVFNVTNGALGIMRLFRWGLPKLPEGLAQRHALIDHYVVNSKPDVVVELASGLSTRSLRIMQDTSLDLRRYVEVDLPHVISYKEQHYQSDHLTLPQGITTVSADVTQLSQSDWSTWLKDTHSPLVIAEGIIMYLKPIEVEKLISQIALQLRPTGGQLIFDWVPTVEQPKPGLVGRILGALMRVFTRGQDFQRDERTRDDMLDLLKKLDAESCQAIDTTQIAEAQGLPYPRVRTQQLIFQATWPTPSHPIDQQANEI